MVEFPPRNFCSMLPRIIAGIYWSGSFQYWPTCSGCVGNNGRRAPATTNPPRLHRPFVDIDATLLESKSSLASGGFGGFQSLAWQVGHLFLAIVQSLTLLFSHL